MARKTNLDELENKIKNEHQALTMPLTAADVTPQQPEAVLPNTSYIESENQSEAKTLKPQSLPKDNVVMTDVSQQQAKEQEQRESKRKLGSSESKHRTSRKAPEKTFSASALVTMSKQDKDRFTAIAQANGLSLSALFRIATNEYIERHNWTGKDKEF